MKSLIVSSIVLLCFALTVFAADGDFDTAGFNTPSGFRVIDVTTAADAGRLILQQSDGKLAVVASCNSRVCIIRHNTDGSLDSTFGGGDGIAETTILGVPTGGALQSDGKILAAFGTSVARFNTDGTVDTSFDGDGQVTTNFGSGSGYNELLLQPDGRIVAVGDRNSGQAFPNLRDIIMARYNADGSLDTTFDGDGILISELTPGGRTEEANDAILTPDGKIVIVGWQGDAVGFANFLLARYNTDGSLDTTFDGDGWLVTDVAPNNNDIAATIALSPTGRYVVGGAYGGGEMDPADAAILLYLSNGTLDTSFDGDGMRLFPGNNGTFTDAVVQADGKIVALMVAATQSIIKFNTNGSFDTTFSGDGQVTVVGAQNLAFQADGRIVASGSRTISGSNSGILTTRLLNTPGPATAAEASLSGRVTTPDGRGVRNATVIVWGGDLETPVMARTSSFGYYRIEGLSVGETYLATVGSRRFSFEPRFLTLNDDVADFDFVAQPASRDTKNFDQRVR